ncbi:diacylglycerol kinase eta-like isoform X4 [Daphnia carinata]|uniref:diacylglycerol kinase eta-like isoform X4 n=1 Tax=Daphnia carinata TaxID=120202 RepID=UPI00286902E8|nr:diacylglycerol kinase eta-like isoform X4 [Daphnia carinata]
MAANEAAISTKPVSAAGDDSSESDGETEPAKSFHRRFSTNKNIKSSVCTREGFLMKQTSSFQRWRRRYFKLKGRTLYYAKDTKSVIFDEISLPDLSVAECSTKNANHSFQVITPFRSLVLCAESRREMEEWITALKAAANKEYYDSADHHDFLSGRHNWYATSHARPTYCNVCREALSGVTSHGLSCEVCKFKSHKRCAVKAINNCKWTTLASVGKDIIEDDEGNIAMPHQWMEGNLPVSAKCSVCDKTCGSVLRLQDWRCLWCRAMVHTACRPQYPVRCPLGPCRVSIVPPTALHSVGTDEAWDAVRPQGCSPLFVFVNSKSGDNQGVKFLRRFKQLLNPAQVFDLMNGGPGLGLRLFRHFDPFRILICSGDGSIGWVLSEIDKLHMDKQCQIGVLPLGTGNDLARVIGWGSVCDDDAHLPQLLERYEKASVKMLDRWSIFTSERSMPLPRKVVLPYEPITAFEDSIVNHLGKILQSDEHTIVISSAKILCETIKEFIGKMAGLHAADDNASSLASGDESIAHKCRVLNEKLDQLLGTLHEEASPLHVGTQRSSVDEEESPDNVESSEHPEIMKSSKEAKESRNEGRAARQKGARKVRAKFNQREALMSRANSLKKAVRQIIEHAERALDEQNGIVPSRSMHSTSASQTSGMVSGGSDIKLIVTHPNDSPVSNEEKMMKQTSSAAAAKSAAMPMALLQLYSAIGGGAGDSSSEPSPCPSPIPMAPSLTTNFPLLPTSPIRYPNPPVFYRMATPPNTQPQRPRSSSSSPRPPSAGRSCYVAHQESAESEGDEDRSAMLSLQAKLNAISPVPDASETRTSCEFDFSALALPVPLEFADTDSLQDVPIDVFDEDTEGRDNVPSVELDEEPAEVEVKPILRPPQQVNISVVVEPPSSEDSSQARPAKDEVDNSRQAEAAEAAVETEDEDEQEAQETAAIARLGERVVEGAEEPVAERTNAAAAARDVETGGLISKVLLANADALCAAVSPLMDVEEDPAEMMDEKCVMNSYFGIGIDAKITLDFHMKREEHPEKCRSRARNYMWYGVLGSKEWLQKTYKNLEQRVLLECDGTRIPLPSLQGIVVLNIPSFMGGTNFWGGNKEDDCFIAPSFDDRVLEVVAVFGSVQMAASRIINLQHHRIAQCHSVKITILGDEGVPVQVDGEAWLQPPGLIRIVHKNRMQMLCRNRALERSLEAWQEKQQRYQLVAGHKMLHGTSLSDDENHVLITFLEATTALVRYVRLLAISQPDLDQELYSLATQASTMLDKMHPGGKIIEGPSLRLHLTDLVNIVRQLHLETDHFLKERAALYNLRPNQEKKLSSSLSHVVCELRKCTDINGLVHFITSEEMSEKKSRAVKSSGGGGGGGAGSNSGGGGGGSNSSGGGSSLFRLKFRRPAESRSRSTSQGHRHNEMGSSDSAVNASEVGTGGRPTNTSSSSVDLSLNVHLWGNDEVAVWLESLQLEEYRDDFIRHDIRGSELLTLERRDLKELGIHKVGHIKRIQQAILEIKENARLSHQSS